MNPNENKKTSCEIINCPHYKDSMCTDPQEFVNQNDEPVCGRRDDAIPIQEDKEHTPEIVNNPQYICLFCGNEMEQKWDENDFYYECDCKDAKENRRIDEEIKKLEEQRPKYKYKIVTKQALYKEE